MVFEVESLEETDDFYEVTLSFRPQGNFDGTPGQEQFVVGKEGTISVRQVLASPVRKGSGFPLLPVAIGLVVVGLIAALGAVFVMMSSGGDSVPVAEVTPNETPTPTETPASAESPALPRPTQTPQPTYTPASTVTPNPTPYPTSTSRPTPLPTATHYPTPTPHPMSTPKPPSGLVFVRQFGDGINGVKNGQLKHPTNLSVASDGSVYVADTGNNRIQKFAPDGAFVTKWGSRGTGDGRFGSDLAVEVAPDGSVYVADSFNHRVQKFTSDGAFITNLGTTGSGDGHFNEPSDVAVAPDGSVYVSDGGNQRIQKFTSDGAFVTKWGGKGKKYYVADGEFRWPSGVAVAPDGSVYVADIFNNDIKKFTSEGVFVDKWGTVDALLPGWGTNGTGTGQFDSPEGVAVAPDGSVYVADSGNNRIQRFTSEGVFISKWGTASTDGGEFNNPHGVAVASDGSLYVADGGNFRVLKFSVVE